MSTHTPGPWIFHTPSLAGFATVRDAEQEAVAAIAHRDFDGPEMAFANTRLIAAAPDLLEALKDLVNAVFNMEGEADAVNYAREVIRRAEGLQ